MEVNLLVCNSQPQGTTKAPGFKERLLAELQAHFPNEKVAIVNEGGHAIWNAAAKHAKEGRTWLKLYKNNPVLLA
jgi:hypothetical protein